MPSYPTSKRRAAPAPVRRDNRPPPRPVEIPRPANDNIRPANDNARSPRDVFRARRTPRPVFGKKLPISPGIRYGGVSKLTRNLPYIGFALASAEAVATFYEAYKDNPQWLQAPANDLSVGRGYWYMARGPHRSIYGANYAPWNPTVRRNRTAYWDRGGKIAAQAIGEIYRLPLHPPPAYHTDTMSWWMKNIDGASVTRYAQFAVWYRFSAQVGIGPDTAQNQLNAVFPPTIPTPAWHMDPWTAPEYPGLGQEVAPYNDPASMPEGLPRKHPSVRTKNALRPYQPAPVRRIAVEPAPASRPLPWTPPSHMPGPAPITVSPPRVQPGQPLKPNPRPSRPAQPAHRQKPPRKREKEKKGKARAALQVIGDAFGAATEFNDILSAAHEALPDRCKQKNFIRGQSVQVSWDQQWREVYRCAGHMDIGKFLTEYAKGQIQDEVIGRISGGASKHLPGRVSGVNRFRRHNHGDVFFEDEEEDD